MFDLDANQLVPSHRRKDPIRPGVKRLRIRVDVMPQNTSIPGVEGVVKHGTQECEIYADDLEKVEAMVEDQWDVIERCKDLADREKRKWMSSRMNGAEVPEDEANWTERMQRLAYQFTETNYISEYCRLTGRPGIRPLRTLEVLETLDPLQDERMAMIRDVASSIGGGGGGDSAEVAGLKAQVARLEQVVERLMSQPRRGRSQDK